MPWRLARRRGSWPQPSGALDLSLGDTSFTPALMRRVNHVFLDRIEVVSCWWRAYERRKWTPFTELDTLFGFVVRHRPASDHAGASGLRGHYTVELIKLWRSRSVRLVECICSGWRLSLMVHMPTSASFLEPESIVLVAGTYEELNAENRPTGRRETLNAGDRLPRSPRRFVWRLVKQ
jgi:hypothetical protein